MTRDPMTPPRVRPLSFASPALYRGRSEQRGANVTVRAVLALAAVLTLAAGCTSSAPTGPSSAAPATSTASPGDTLNLDITISQGQVHPNGEKIDVRRGETVVLNVTSDSDDEVHAHTGGDGHEFEVKAGQPFRGQFTVPDPGSFEVESHHLNKIIVILNVR